MTNLNLKDYQDKTIAKIIISKDITNYIVENKNSLRTLNYLTVIAILIILVLLYIIFTNYSKELKRTLIRVDILNKESAHFQNKANIDDLTQIYNKSYFDNYLNEFFSLGKKGSIIFFDIDHFKKLNHYGLEVHRLHRD